MARPATRPWSDDELVVKYSINAANITREYPPPGIQLLPAHACTERTWSTDAILAPATPRD